MRSVSTKEVKEAHRLFFNFGELKVVFGNVVTGGCRV